MSEAELRKRLHELEVECTRRAQSEADLRAERDRFAHENTKLRGRISSLAGQLSAEMKKAVRR